MYIQLLDFSVGKVKICNVCDQNTAINGYIWHVCCTYVCTCTYNVHEWNPYSHVYTHICSVHTYVRVIVSKSEAQEIYEIWQQCTVYT